MSRYWPSRTLRRRPVPATASASASSPVSTSVASDSVAAASCSTDTGPEATNRTACRRDTRSNLLIDGLDQDGRKLVGLADLGGAGVDELKQCQERDDD